MRDKKPLNRESGFTLVELCTVLAGAFILLCVGVPVLNTAMNQYQLTLAAQNIVSQLQFTRMKSVTSNESFRLNFPAGQRFYRIEAADGSVVAGPYWLPPSVTLNTIDTGTDVTFGGRYVSFSPTGDAAAVGNGSAGRVKIMNQNGRRIDIVVGTGGIIRQTPVYASPPVPF